MKQKYSAMPATGIFISVKDSRDSLVRLVKIVALLNELYGEQFDVVLVENGVVGEVSASEDVPSPSVSSEPETPPLPKELDVDEIRQMLQSLADYGELTADWQLRNQSWTERAVIVAYLSGKLGKKCMWSAFAQLWHCDKNGLRSAYDQRCDTASARKYYQKLEKILDAY